MKFKTKIYFNFLCILILFIILYNQHFIHFLFIKLPKLLYKLNKLDINYLQYQYRQFKIIGLESFILKGNKKIITPFRNYKVINNVKNITDTNIYNKKESLSIIVNSITTPHNLLGNWKADSIFRMNYEDRGKNNHLKKLYMYAFHKDKNEFYKKKINLYLGNKFQNIFFL